MESIAAFGTFIDNNDFGGPTKLFYRWVSWGSLWSLSKRVYPFYSEAITETFKLEN